MCNFSETKEKPKINDTEPENDEIEAVEMNEELEESPSKTEDLQQQTALRKMVLQVIFGAGSNSVNQDAETADNMFAIAMNGEIEHSAGSGSSPEPYDVVEAVSSSSTSPFTSTGSTTSPVSTSDDAVEILEQSSLVKEENKNMRQHKTRVTSTLEIERLFSGPWLYNFKILTSYSSYNPFIPTNKINCEQQK